MTKLKNGIRKFFSDLKKSYKQALLPTIVAGVIFLVTWYVFGTANSMIAPFATLAFMRLRSMHNYYASLIKNFLVFFAMAALAYFAVINIGLCILVNACALFFIAYLLIDEYQPTNYMPAGLALIFFQIAPVTTLPALGLRFGALAVTMGIVFAAVGIPYAIRQRRHPSDPIRELIQKGFAKCEEIFAACDAKDGDVLTGLHDDMADINHAISMHIYSYNRSTFRRKGKVNWYCRFVLIFQVINYLTRHDKNPVDVQKAKGFFLELQKLFAHVTPENDYRHLHFRVNRPDMKNFRFRYALRLMIVLSPCLAIALYFSDSMTNIYWLPMSTFVMMIPYSNDTKTRVKQRLGGTICGLVICFILFSFFGELPGRMTIMMIANFFIYSANGYGATVVYITCSALAVQTLDIATGAALAQRLIYTLIGAGITLFANRFIFRIRKQKQIDFMLEILEKLRWNLKQLADLNGYKDADNPLKDDKILISGLVLRKVKAGTLTGECLHHQTDQLIIKSYMLTYRIRALNESLPPGEHDPKLKDKEIEHMNFMASYMERYGINRGEGF